MNKRTSIFYITTVAVAIACLILDLIFPNKYFSFLGICFAITMMVYGICLIVRGFRFKIDSSLFLGIIIFTFGVITTLTYFTPWGYLELLCYLWLGASLASFVTGLYFKINVQKKLSILFLGLFVLSFLHQIGLYNMWVMLLSFVALVFGFIVVNNVINSRRG